MPGIDKTDKYYRVRQRNPEDFEENSFRTIDITDGIKAVVGKLKGENTTSVQTLLFDIEKFTEEEVKEWINKHKQFKIMSKLNFASPLTLVKGKTYIKEIAKAGNWTDGYGKTIEFSKKIFDDIIEAFYSRADKVPVVMSHSLDVLNGCGWVIDVWQENDSLFAKVKITDDEVIKKIDNGSIQDNSIGLVRENGKWLMEHLALTLIPCITGLSEFQKAEYERQNEARVACFGDTGNYAVFENSFTLSNQGIKKIIRIIKKI